MYFAKQYTADPRIGWLTPGETLSDEQVKKLGEETLNSMIQRGVIGMTESGNGKNTGKAEPEKADGQVKPDGETAPDAGKVNPDSETEPEPEDEEELPVLEISGEMVGEAEPEPPKKKGRGKRS